MAIGLRPKYLEEYPLSDLTKNQFIGLITEAAEKLNWRIDHNSVNGLIAYTNKGIFSVNAET